MSNYPIYAGSTHIMVNDTILGISFPVLIQYPSTVPSKPVSFGPYTMEVSLDAGMAHGVFPLVVISHGNGGSHLLYRSISTHLAKQGYIVALPEHYGNNRNNNQFENTTENLTCRPRHVMLTIDSILQHIKFNKSVLPDSIAVIGHSMGGYTALALAGGEARTMEGLLIETPADSRIKALVLLAPGAGWFLNGLNKVTIPILMLTAEHDPITPAWNAEVVLNGVPDQAKVIHRMEKNAGHFSFLSPFPEVMKKPGFLPATDPEGFDREAFHERLPYEVQAFLDGALKKKAERNM